MAAPKLIANNGEKLEENDEQTLEQENSKEITFGPCPGPPDWMGFEAKMEWIRSAEDLHEKGRLKGGVISLLENYCVAVGLARELEKTLQDDGKIIAGKPHPAYKMLLEAIASSKQLAGEIGFTRRFGQTPEKEESQEEPTVWGGDKSLLA